MAMADGYVMEHRKVLFEAGFDVPDGYHVHHINHVKDDNRLENLKVMSEREHHRHHAEEGTPIINQWGTFKALSPEERKAKQQARMKVWREANVEHRKAYKAARKAAGLPS
jgi:hypothetical protein